MRPLDANATDAELLRTGDPDAFTVVYDRNGPALYAWARSRVGEEASDLTAEVFARAWLSRSSFRDEAGGTAAPWLFGIAQNLLRKSLRKRQVESRARSRLALPTAIAPDPEYENVERRLSLPPEALVAIAGLSDAERSLLELRVVEECRYDEIADRLSISPQAARLRMSRALRRLKLALGGDQP